MSGIQRNSLADAITAGINSTLFDTHTAIPGEVDSYDSALQQVQVKVSIKRVVSDVEYDYPIMEGVPVVFPRSSSGGFSFSLQKGDGVLLIFSERNLDKWKTTGSGFAPLDSRKFDISDCFAIPGAFPIPGVMVPPPYDATELRGAKVFVGDPLQFTTPIANVPTTGTPAGKPTVVPPEQLDLINILVSFMKLMDGAVYGVPADATKGGGGIDVVTTMTLATLIADLEKLKP